MSQRDKEKAGLQQAFGEMYDELWAWREEHPEASFDEIAGQVTPRRRAVMMAMVKTLASQHGTGQAVTGQSCPECGGEMVYKGAGQGRVVVHYLEGETELKRAYYYCPACESGLFPPG